MTGFGSIRKGLHRALAQLCTFDNRSYIMEEKQCFDHRVLDLKIKQKVYCQGYWQSELYFKDIEPVFDRI